MKVECSNEKNQETMKWKLFNRKNRKGRRFLKAIKWESIGSFDRNLRSIGACFVTSGGVIGGVALRARLAVEVILIVIVIVSIAMSVWVRGVVSSVTVTVVVQVVAMRYAHTQGHPSFRPSRPSLHHIPNSTRPDTLSVRISLSVLAECFV